MKICRWSKDRAGMYWTECGNQMCNEVGKHSVLLPRCGFCGESLLMTESNQKKTGKLAGGAGL